MAPAIPSSINNISFTPEVALISKKSNILSRCSFPRKLNKLPLPAQKYILPLSTSVRLFPQFRIGCSLKPKLRTHIASATGTDVAVEEAEAEASVTVTDAAETTEASAPKTDINTNRTKPPRSVRKSDFPPVKNEDLIPGATFTGKVRSIQPFGAFVDFGAFTDGLVHVSQLSDSFVKDVSSVVTIGQEVTVKLVEANMETGRISLTMRVNEAPSGEKSRPPRKTGQNYNQKKEDTKSSKFVKGQDLAGTVKSIIRAGAFISLPEGEEGFLPTSEEADEGFVNMMGGSSMEIGQEVNVRVLRITRGQVTLTMKKEEAGGELDAKLTQGVLHTATNPFVLAFRSNKDISAFLDERENENQLVEKVEEDAKDTVGEVTVIDETSSEIPDKEEDVVTLPENSQSNDVEIESSKAVEASTVIPSDDEPSPIEEADISSEIVVEATEVAVAEEVKEKTVEDVIAKDEDQSEKADSTDPVATQGEEGTDAPNPDENGSIESSSAQIDSLDLETTSTGL